MKKKICAIAVAMAMTFSMGMTVFAVTSPTGTATDQTAAERSPRTGDLNLLYVELTGVALAVTAVVAKKRSEQEA